MNRHDKSFQAELVADYSLSHLRFLNIYNNSWDVECFHCHKLEKCKTRLEARNFLFDHEECTFKATPVVEAPVVEAVEPTVAVELELSEDQLRQMRVMGFDTVEAFIEHIATHPIVPNPEKAKTRKRKASSEPRKRSITEKPRKVRTRKSKQVVESFEGYTTKKLAELVEQPYTDTGLEVCQETAWEEYCLRLDAMSDDMIAEYLEEPKAHVAENPADWAGIIGFEDQSEEEAAPVIVVQSQAPVALPPPIRPDMIRKPMPPAPPSDFEWILPPVPKASLVVVPAPVRAGLFSRVWSALKKIA